MASFGMKVIRGVFGAAEHVAPRLSGRAAFELFCVAVHEFRPEPGREPRGTVLVIHGWRSRTEYMRALIEGFRGAGYKVVSLDLPGHGHSLGRHLNMVNAVEAVRVTG
ncbi:MAG: alpha/beta hydrolase, partial [Mesorhizobium sp.]